MRIARAFARDRSGVSALEFAIGAPVLLLLLLVGFDTTRYIMATRRIQVAAATVGQMLSVSSTGQIAPAELQFYQDSTMVIFPQVLQDSYAQGIDWSKVIDITVSSILFTGTSPNYTGLVKWSAGANLRPCNVPMTATAYTATPSRMTLPTDVFGPGSLIVVDLSFEFRPLISSKLMSPISILRSFYVQPRYVAALTYTGSGGTQVNQC